MLLILKKGEKTRSAKLEYIPDIIYVDFDEEKVIPIRKSEPVDTSYIFADWIPQELSETIIDGSICDKKVNADHFDVVESFINEQKQMPGEFQLLIQENFWDLVD